MTTETGIENEARYKRTEERVRAGVHLLVWIAVYAAAVCVVLMDVLVWRPN